MERKSLHPNGWTCPECKKNHSKPHWKDSRQRIYGLLGKKEYFADTCKESEAEERLDDGVPKPLFCPHCAWTEDRVILVKQHV